MRADEQDSSPQTRKTLHDAVRREALAVEQAGDGTAP
jgi:hypothetical protein